MEPSETHSERVIDPVELIGTRLVDRYGVVRLTSQGANTAIFDAEDEQTGRAVTLKLVHPQLAASPTFRNRFDEQMRAVSALSHPNIAAVYDWGMARIGDTSTAYVVIEHLTGGSLRDMFDRGRRLSPSQALVVGLDACRGLDHAHRRGFVHGELTPSKLVFGDDRRLRIIDFGLARLLGESAWEHPESVSTHVAWYASPEQGRGHEIDGKTDVYALCLSLHEAVTGALPFKHDSTVASLDDRRGRLMPVSADLGPLASVFERAGRPEPEERASAAEFGKGLVQVASKLPRPEPLPILSTGMFDTPVEHLRSPDDPTGGVTRPGSGRAAPLVVVPIDEPDAADIADIGDVDDVGDVGDPTGRVSHDQADAAGVDDAPGAEVDVPVAAAEDPTAVDQPDAAGVDEAGELPVAESGDALVILPLDAGVDAGGVSVDDPPSASAAVEPFESPAAGRATQVMPVYDAHPAPARRRFPWLIVTALVVVAALVALGVLAATQFFKTPVYEIPDLQDMPEAEALNLIATNEWAVDVERERSDAVPVVGRVVRTVPGPGVELARGEPFLMVVSLGPTLRELPEATGLPASEVQTLLVQRGLVATLVDAHDEEVPEGLVVSWSVPGDPTLAAGARVEPETVVELVVSIGPAPRTMPSLGGLPVGDARAEIERLQLVFTEQEHVFHDEVPLGSVISQTIEPGTQVERDTEVAVVVSKGPDLVVFPDLAGVANYEEAAQVLVEAGFTPVLTFGDAQGPIQSFTVDGTAPTIGQTYRRGTQVDFVAGAFDG